MPHSISSEISQTDREDLTEHIKKECVNIYDTLFFLLESLNNNNYRDTGINLCLGVDICLLFYTSIQNTNPALM